MKVQNRVSDKQLFLENSHIFMILFNGDVQKSYIQIFKKKKNVRYAVLNFHVHTFTQI